MGKSITSLVLCWDTLAGGNLGDGRQALGRKHMTNVRYGVAVSEAAAGDDPADAREFVCSNHVRCPWSCLCTSSCRAYIHVFLLLLLCCCCRG